jgi:hypothetical protein
MRVLPTLSKDAFGFTLKIGAHFLVGKSWFCQINGIDICN